MGRKMVDRRAYSTSEQEAKIASMQWARHKPRSLSVEGDYRLWDARVIQGPKSRLLPDAKVAKEHHTDGMRAKEATPLFVTE